MTFTAPLEQDQSLLVFDQSLLQQYMQAYPESKLVTATLLIPASSPFNYLNQPVLPLNPPLPAMNTSPRRKPRPFSTNELKFIDFSIGQKKRASSQEIEDVLRASFNENANPDVGTIRALSAKIMKDPRWVNNWFKENRKNVYGRRGSIQISRLMENRGNLSRRYSEPMAFGAQDNALPQLADLCEKMSEAMKEKTRENY